MSRLKSLRVVLGGVVIVAVALAATFGTFLALPKAASSSTGSANATTFTSHPVSVNPQYVPAGDPSNAVFGCQTNRGPSSIVCYSPQQIWQAYGTSLF